MERGLNDKRMRRKRLDCKLKNYEKKNNYEGMEREKVTVACMQI